MSKEIEVVIESSNPVADPVQMNRVKYDDVSNKPRINGVELVGDKSTADLKIDVDTSKFATKDELSGKADKTDIPDVSGKADKSEIPDVSNFATKDEIPDVSQFVTQETVETMIGDIESALAEV